MKLKKVEVVDDWRSVVKLEWFTKHRPSWL